jgi:TonB family protein
VPSSRYFHGSDDPRAPSRRGRTSSRPGVPGDSVPGIDIRRDERAKVTYYSPRFDHWPQPEVMVYPAIAKSDSGSRTVALRMTLRDVRLHAMDSIELRVDGDPVKWPANQKDAVTFDASGCQSITRVNLEQQEALARKIASGQQIEISFGKRATQRYHLDGDDLDRFKRIVALLDMKELPQLKALSGDDIKSGVISPEAEDVTPPRLLPNSRTAPQYPKLAFSIRGRVSRRVVLSAHIRKDGTVGDVTVLHEAGGACGFEESSIAAVKTWKYAPATRNGEPIDVDYIIVVEFSMG